MTVCLWAGEATIIGSFGLGENREPFSDLNGAPSCVLEPEWFLFPYHLHKMEGSEQNLESTGWMFGCHVLSLQPCEQPLRKIPLESMAFELLE